MDPSSSSTARLSTEDSPLRPNFDPESSSGRVSHPSIGTHGQLLRPIAIRDEGASASSSMDASGSLPVSHGFASYLPRRFSNTGTWNRSGSKPGNSTWGSGRSKFSTMRQDRDDVTLDNWNSLRDLVDEDSDDQGDTVTSGIEFDRPPRRHRSLRSLFGKPTSPSVPFSGNLQTPQEDEDIPSISGMLSTSPPQMEMALPEEPPDPRTPLLGTRHRSQSRGRSITPAIPSNGINLTRKAAQRTPI